MKNQQPTICISSNLIKLRKKMGWTQEELAAQLFVSGKTVSKWERGMGYPELPQLLKLSSVFGVSIDRLLREERYGIAIAGNMLTDQVKRIDSYPEKQMLSSIRSVSRAVGGCVPNTAIDLARMDPSVPVSAIGKVGEDECGEYILNELKRYRINTDRVLISGSSATSFSDVMSVDATGERTFFHYRGANAEFSPEEIDVSSLNCKMLHVGYIQLLDRFDAPNAEYGTEMAKFLCEAQRAGIRTSVDAVSTDEGYEDAILPALKYADNAVMNEIEGCGAAGIPPRDTDGRLLTENVRAAMQILLDCGVRERVILHCPEAGFLLSRDGEFVVVPSLKLPKGFLKGSVGAGDAFCAGCLWGIYQGIGNREILEFASGAAACNLSEADSVSGMRSKDEIFKLISSMPRQKPLIM